MNSHAFVVPWQGHVCELKLRVLTKTLRLPPPLDLSLKSWESQQSPHPVADDFQELVLMKLEYPKGSKIFQNVYVPLKMNTDIIITKLYLYFQGQGL